MEILLVDDDRFVLQALEQKIDWQRLGVSHVHTAANMRQARAILKNHPIELLISDIEMPQGSGLELLASIREEGNQVQTIFLTNYADFNYAQKAIELQSFEYYLKPIDFEKLSLVIKKALRQVREQQKLTSHSPQKRQLIDQLFWQKTLAKPRTGKLAEWLTVPEFEQVSVTTQTAFVVALGILFPYEISWQPIQLTPALDVTKALQHILTTLQAAFPEFETVSAFRREEAFDSFTLVIPLKTHDVSPQLIQGYLDQLREQLKTSLRWDSLFSHSAQSSLGEIEERTRELYLSADTQIRSRRTLGKQAFWEPLSSPPLPHKSFERLLYAQDWHACFEFIEQDLHQRLSQGHIESHYLKAFKLDLMQSLHSYLTQKEVLAHQLLQTEAHHFLANRCFNSIESFLDYFHYTLKTALTYIQWANSQKSVAIIVKDYIDEHHATDINRNLIAELVFLSPDHVARIFKKELGISLGAYIIERRLAEAKKLLTTTQLPVNVIATNVGYDNYSYFTKLFKKNCAYTPLDYRASFSP